MRHASIVACVVLVAATVLLGWRTEPETAESDTKDHLTLPSGTTIEVVLATPLTSEAAEVGSAWTGSVRHASVVHGRNVIPARSSVAGTVMWVRSAREGDRAMLDLRLTSITVAGHRYTVQGSTEAIVAGSTRARKLGSEEGTIIGYPVVLKKGTPLTFTTDETLAVRH